MRARRGRGLLRPRDAAPVDVRQILRDAAKEADSREKERGAAAHTYLERHGESTYLQRMEALLQNAGIGDPPPQSSTGAHPEAEAEAEVGAEAEAEMGGGAEAEAEAEMGEGAEAEAEAETGGGAEAEEEAEAEEKPDGSWSAHIGRRSSPLSFEDLITGYTKCGFYGQKACRRGHPCPEERIWPRLGQDGPQQAYPQVSSP